MRKMNGPLAGVRVIELTAQLSGPFAGMLLGDLGADVIKVEAPKRLDPGRSMPSIAVGGQRAYYLSLNRNKRSVLLDLKDRHGHAAFMRLVARSDVVLDNFRAGVTARLGVDHDRLAVVNPAIITCSLTAFGETGPLRDRPGYDYMMQALAGTMDLTGDPDGAPTKYGISVVDHVGGITAALGVVAALHGRQRDPQGRGTHLDLALFDTHLPLLSYVAAEYLNGGKVPARQRLSAHPTAVPSQTFPTADGYIVVMPLADHFFPLLCNALDLPELASDPRFVDPERRLENRIELLSILEPLFVQRPSEEWVRTLEAHGVPVAPVQTVAQALEMEQVHARNMTLDLEHPAYGPYRVVGNPFKFSTVGDLSGDAQAAPTPGEHTVEILTDIAGLEPAEVESVLRSGAQE